MQPLHKERFSRVAVCVTRYFELLRGLKRHSNELTGFGSRCGEASGLSSLHGLTAISGLYLRSVATHKRPDYLKG